jgi:hypothetical protein
MAVSRDVLVREDLKKINKQFYSTRDHEVTVYEIPEMKFIHTVGVGEHNIYRMNDFNEIWTMSRFINRVKHYTVNEISKNFSRMPLEVEWGELLETGVEFKAMMAVPEYISETFYKSTMTDLHKRVGELNFKINLETILQGKCAQILHKGRYQDIGRTIEILKEELHKREYKLRNRHREIYMNHPHCNPPEKLQILIRQPIE